MPVSKSMRTSAFWTGFVLAALTLGPGSALAQRGTTKTSFPLGAAELSPKASVAAASKVLDLDLPTMPRGQTAVPQAAAGQVSAASIKENVVRAENTPVAGAEVKLRRMAGDGDDKTFEERIEKTAEDGTFAVHTLERGTYTLVISAKFADESMLPCMPSGLLARNRNRWLMAVGRGADGGIVQIVTSDPIALATASAPRLVIDLRCAERAGRADRRA